MTSSRLTVPTVNVTMKVLYVEKVLPLMFGSSCGDPWCEVRWSGVR